MWGNTRQSQRLLYFVVAGIILVHGAPAISWAQEEPAPDSGPDTTSNPSTEGSGQETTPAAKADDGKLRLGTFVFDPRISFSEFYDDNIFATRNDKVDDFISVIAPSLRIESEWSKHELDFYASADIGRYAENEAEDYEDYRVGADGRFDLSRTFNLFGGARYSWDHEERDSPDGVAGLEPTEFEDLFGYMGGQGQFGRFSIRVGGTVEELDYHDVASTGGTINNDDRDRDLYAAGSRLGFLIRPGMEVFVQGESDTRRYVEGTDDAGADRDSDGFNVATGLKLDFGGGTRLEVLGGYLDQDYQDNDLRDVSTFDLGARLRMRPSTQTTITGLVDRTVEETTTTGASSYIATTFGAGVRHWLSPDAALDAELYFTIDDYVGIDRQDDLIEAALGYSYYLDPRVWIGADYRFSQRNSDAPAEDYDENRIFFRLGIQQWPEFTDADMAAYRSRESTEDGIGGLYGGVQAQFGELYTGLDGPRGAGGDLTADFGDHGGAGGFFVGYGWQIENWYLGAELDGELSKADWDHDRSPGGRFFSVEKESSVAANARLGYVMPGGSLLFGQFGIVGTEFETRYVDSDSSVERDEFEPGIRLGGGVEVPMGESMFARLGYSYTAYRDYDIDVPPAPDNFSNTESLASLGFGYRFGGNPEPDANAEAANNPFSGFYIGAQGGYGGLTTENEGPREGGSTLEADRGSHGATGGLMAGYGHRLSDIYLGVELEGEVSDVDWSIDRDPTGRKYAVEKGFSYGGSLIAGYVIEDVALLYARGGMVMSEFDTSYETGGANVNADDTEFGWRFGGGIEVPATDTLSIRMDYTYTTYDEYDVEYGENSDSFDNSESLFRIGVIHRF